jgi:hypothetical protein
VIQHFGQSDAATYVKGAYALREGGIRAYCDQGFRTWSPGLSFIEMILMGMWHDIPLPFALLLLTFAAWAVFMLRLSMTLREIFDIRPSRAFLIPLLLLLVPFVWNAYLWHLVVFSEPLSAALFALATLECWRLLVRPEWSFKKSIGIGLLFAAAAYLRAQFELIFLTFMCASWLLVLLTLYRKTATSRSYLYIVLTVTVAYHALVLPYKIYLHSPAMVVNSYI